MYMYAYTIILTNCITVPQTNSTVLEMITINTFTIPLNNETYEMCNRRVTLATSIGSDGINETSYSNNAHSMQFTFPCFGLSHILHAWMIMYVIHVALIMQVTHVALIMHVPSV